LKVLNDELLSPVPISELLEDQNVRFSPDGNDVLPQTIMATFANLLLEVGRKDLGYKMVKSSGRITFNKKAFAECVMDYYSLKVDQSNPEELLVYNNEKGFWENGTQPLHRLIIEIAHSAGEDVIDTWTSHLENSIIDILKRKVDFVESANFNKKHFPFGNYTLHSNTGDMVRHDPYH